MRSPGLPKMSVQLAPSSVERTMTMRGESVSSSEEGRPSVGLPCVMSTRSCQATKTVPSPVTAAVGKPFERKLRASGFSRLVEIVGWSKGAMGTVPVSSSGLLHFLP